MQLSLDGLRINMAKNILNFIDSLKYSEIELPEKSNELLDQCMCDIRFLGYLNFCQDMSNEKDGGFISEKMDELFKGYLED